jgi:hypothetical protein
MTVLALTTVQAILAWLGVALLLVVAVVVLLLLEGVRRPVAEIDRYAEDILEGAQGISSNLEGAEQLGTTRELATAVPGLATAYLRKAGLA